MPPTALTTSTSMLPDAAQLQAMLQFAETLLHSGLLPQHIKSPAAAFAVIQKGRELNIPPMLALANIIVVQGKPTANAELMAGLIQRDQGDDALRFVAAECTETRAVLLYKRRSWAKPERFTFTIDDARRANLIKAGPWTQYPGAMLRARAISAVARMAFADSIGGLFTPEELGASVHVTSDGEVVVDVVPERETTDHETGEMPAPAAPTNHRAAAPSDDSDLPASNSMYKVLVGLISQVRTFDATVGDPAPNMTRGEARTMKAFLEGLIEDARLAAAPL